MNWQLKAPDFAQNIITLDVLNSRLENKYLMFLLDIFKKSHNLQFDTLKFLQTYYYEKHLNKQNVINKLYNIQIHQIRRIIKILQLPTNLEIYQHKVNLNIDEDLFVNVCKYYTYSINWLKEHNPDLNFDKNKNRNRNKDKDKQKKQNNKIIFNCSEPDFLLAKQSLKCPILSKLASSFVEKSISFKLTISNDKDIFSKYKQIFDEYPSNNLVNLIKFYAYSSK